MRCGAKRSRVLAPVLAGKAELRELAIEGYEK
jgi:hypothetical protein